MKIHSWNVCYHNKKPDQVLAYITNLDFDVLCLQEVPEAMLGQLEALPYHFVSTVDVTFHHKDQTLQMYSVILSRYPIQHSGSFTLPLLHLRKQAWLLFRIKERWSDIGERNFLYIDVESELGPVRVFGIHLTLSSVANRKQELDLVKKHIPDGRQAIIAGDFNIIEHPFLRLLHWFMGSPLGECLPGHTETLDMEQYEAGLGLQNPLANKITHTISQSQLDRILIPKTAIVTEAGVANSRYGSDHYPVFVDISV